MVKFLAFEIVILSTQTTPLMQTTLLVVIQIFSITVTVFAVIKKIFVHQYISIKNIVLDLAILMYFLYTMFIVLCKNGSTGVCFTKGHKQKVFFTLIAIIALTLLASTFYLSYCIYLGIQKIKKNKIKNVFALGFGDEKQDTESELDDDEEEIFKKKRIKLRKKMVENSEVGDIDLYTSKKEKRKIKGRNSLIKSDYDDTGNFLWSSKKKELEKMKELVTKKARKKKKRGQNKKKMIVQKSVLGQIPEDGNGEILPPAEDIKVVSSQEGALKRKFSLKSRKTITQDSKNCFFKFKSLTSFVEPDGSEEIIRKTGRKNSLKRKMSRRLSRISEDMKKEDQISSSENFTPTLTDDKNKKQDGDIILVENSQDEDEEVPQKEPVNGEVVPEDDLKNSKFETINYSDEEEGN